MVGVIACTALGAFILVHVLPILVNFAVFSRGAWTVGRGLARFTGFFYGKHFESTIFYSEAADARLEMIEQACSRFRLAKAGFLLQRAWIAAHRGRTRQALDLCAMVNRRWLPRIYRAEYHFTRAAALLADGRLDEAEAALTFGDVAAVRGSSKRNVLFLRARVAAARGDWADVERCCRAAAEHLFRSQGGDGLLLWATALNRLGRRAEASDALRLVTERDPESAAAREASAALDAA